VSILENFPADTIDPILVLPQAWVSISSRIAVREGLPSQFNIPYRFLGKFKNRAVDYQFRRCMRYLKPGDLAYFWPAPSLKLLRSAHSHEMVTVREMINTCIGTAKILLEEAYEIAGILNVKIITEQQVEEEKKELSFYDYVFASNPFVEQSLIATGIPAKKILISSFGWSPERYLSSLPAPRTALFRALFVGRLCVRKGVVQLLKAWKRADLDGELLLIGDIEPALEPWVRSMEEHGVRHISYTPEVGSFYKSSDVFIFPTIEEGGPQVTYEAAGCGLPVIATPMGSARIVRDGVNGFIVQPYDIDQLAAAIVKIANDPDLRQRMSLEAEKDAQQFTYEKIGYQRGRILAGIAQIPPVS
jgi:glycosyltransferase involved in cell wall biosynthesis